MYTSQNVYILKSIPIISLDVRREGAYYLKEGSDKTVFYFALDTQGPGSLSAKPLRKAGGSQVTAHPQGSRVRMAMGRIVYHFTTSCSPRGRCAKTELSYTPRHRMRREGGRAPGGPGAPRPSGCASGSTLPACPPLPASPPLPAPPPPPADDT